MEIASLIADTDAGPLKLEDLMNKACSRAVFLPDGRNSFAGRVEDLNTWICNTIGQTRLEFANEGKRGLFIRPILVK